MVSFYAVNAIDSDFELANVLIFLWKLSFQHSFVGFESSIIIRFHTESKEYYPISILKPKTFLHKLKLRHEGFFSDSSRKSSDIEKYNVISSMKILKI